MPTTIYGDRTNLAGVAEAFCKGNPASSDHFYTDGKWVWSYSLPLAKWQFGSIKMMVVKGGHSATTSRHLSVLLRAIQLSGVEVLPADGTDTPRLHSDN